MDGFEMKPIFVFFGVTKPAQSFKKTALLQVLTIISVIITLDKFILLRLGVAAPPDLSNRLGELDCHQ